MLWEQLDPEERSRLTTAHRQRYHMLANYLYNEDRKKPHEARAVARRELPNFLHAAGGAFAAEDPGAVDFADSVTRFLNNFGLPREAERLTALSQAAAGEEGSKAWYLAQSNRGEQLRAAGWAAEAAELFRRILDRLGDTPSYERATDRQPPAGGAAIGGARAPAPRPRARAQLRRHAPRAAGTHPAHRRYHAGDQGAGTP